ncbi:MAG: tRNA pseudouridine(38-40) synthase TruA [Oscillospiraceae bacterium]|nr:tRNA pseudouridine(38-40) synthase TruA [Oscillospiraceae bacterium]
MINYKITVSYDGTRYKGWQVLKSGDNTIQGKLEQLLSRLTGQEMQVIGSGRTDGGVHAIGQTANFHLDPASAKKGLDAEKLSLSPEALMLYFNKYLPDDIAVTSCEEVPERFHARYGAKSKTYRYTIRTSPVPDVFRSRFVYAFRAYPLDVDLMKKAAASLLGEHDFTSFCGNRHFKKSAVRNIFSIDFSEVRDDKTWEILEIYIDYTGDGFLQNMIRIITGTLIEIGSGRREADSIPTLIRAKNRELAGFTAPASGLCLMKVEY